MSELPGPLLEDYRARLAEPSHREGGGNDIKDEMPYLLRRAQRYQGVRVLEIGVRSGRSTSAFLVAAGRSLIPGHVWSIDMAVPQVPDQWHRCGYWTFRQARSGDVSPELEGWPAAFDVLFIDGDHSVMGVLGDLRRFVPYVAAGGVVLCHDTKLVNPALLPAETSRVFQDGDAYHVGRAREVAQALDLFCAEYHLAARELPWQPGVLHTPKPLAWTERGGQFGLGVLEDPNGAAS
jgi:predicted O-methyltransferase YrrM